MLVDDLFARTRLLLGQDGLDRLAAARVAVFGIGGVGGYAVEALARSGVGALDLVDSDTVDPTNLNRQIIATMGAIGRPKTQVAAERVASINPSCIVRPRQCFFLPETADQFDFAAFDYVIDAVDTVSAKIALVEAAFAAGVPIVSSMGAGNKLDPTAFRVADIYETSVDPLARVMRRELRRRGIPSLKVVYSTEPPLVPADDDMAVKDGTHPAPGSVAFVPSRSRPHSRRGSGEGLGGLLKRTAACSSAPGYSETVGRWRDESTGDGSGAGSGDGSGAG